MKRLRKVFVLLFALFLAACSAGPAAEPAERPETAPEEEAAEEADEALDEDGFYYSLEDVTAYLKTYGRLPDNYITKDEARDLGWDPDEGNLWDVADGYVIGGDRFGNREGLLPDSDYREADINYSGGYRGAERIVYDGENIYYTSDHYNSFEKVE